MRIEGAYIDGFGHFHGREIGPFDGPMAIIMGANEAGKSTLLSFVRTVLFGFPSRLSDQLYPPLAGGYHGGRLAISDGNGSRYLVERYRGVRGGPVTITDEEDGSELDSGALHGLLGTPSELFESIYAFGLDELQDVKSLSGDEVSGRIYSAGIGAAGLPALLKRLSDKRAQIYRRSGQNQPVAATLRDLQEVESQLAEHQKQASEYGDLVSGREELTREVAKMASERTALGERIRELERLSRAWDEWAGMGAVDEELKTLPVLKDFPEDAVPRLEALDARVRESREALKDAEDELAGAMETAGRPIVDESLLEDRQHVEQIRRGRTSIDASIGDLPKREAELLGLEAALEGSLAELGPGWNEDRLSEFTATIAMRDEVEQSRQRLEVTGQEARDRATALRRLEREQGEVSQALEETRATSEAVSEPSMSRLEIDGRWRALRASRGQLSDLNQIRHNRGNLEAQLEVVPAGAEEPEPAGWRHWLVPALLVIGGVIALVAALVIGGQEVAVAAGALAAVAGIAIYVVQASGTGATVKETSPYLASLRRRAESVQEDERTIEAELRSTASSLGLGIPTADELDGIEEELVAAQEMHRVRSEAQGHLEGAVRDEERKKLRFDEEREANATAVEDDRHARVEWADWLKAKRFPEALTPATVGQMLERIETAKTRQARVVEMRHRVEAIRVDIGEYLELVQPLADRHGETDGEIPADRLSDIADRLIARLEAAVQAADRRTTDREVAELKKGTAAQARGRHETHTKELDGLIRAGGTGDAEEFRRRAADHQRRAELEQEKRAIMVHLRQSRGPNGTVEELISDLERTDLDNIRADSENFSEKLAEVNESHDRLVEDRVRTEARLGQLASEEESSALRARKALLVEQLRAHADEWSKYTLAKALLNKARQKYERERQPGVVRHAEEFFKTVTGGRYSRLYARLGEQAITVVDSDGATKADKNLSRGTREQLYLALRFGLVRILGEHAERMPVVVDDVLVNFDPERARHAAEAFVELSETNQVLVFTCHPNIVELFEKAAPGVQVIELDGNGRSGTAGQARLI